MQKYFNQKGTSKYSRISGRNSFKYLLLLFISIVVIIGCNENSSIMKVESVIENLSSFSKQKQTTSENLAKLLAIDLNENENLRKEIFTKIAARYDGDLEVIFSNLQTQTLNQIESFSKEIATEPKFQKSNASKTFLNSISQINTNDLLSKFHCLQIAMPYAFKWSDEAIQKVGGLVVAYYPFGIKDINIKEMFGYNKNGERITITEKNAPEIPYIILTENERVRMMEQKLKDPKLSVLYSEVNIKELNIPFDNQWTSKNISSLEPEVSKNLKNEIKNLENALKNNPKNKNKNSTMTYAEDPGGDGSGGNGSGGGGSTTHSWGPSQTLHLTGFEVINVHDYEGYWTNGEPEFETRVAFVPLGGGDGNATITHLDLLNNYDGWDVLVIWPPPFYFHHYRGGWVYGEYGGVQQLQYIQEGIPLLFYVAECDGGDDITKIEQIPNPYGLQFIATFPFHSADTFFTMGTIDPSGQFPQILMCGDFHAQFDTY